MTQREVEGAAFPAERRAASDSVMAHASAGRCTVCGLEGPFEQQHRSIREGFQCQSCRASLRYRHQAAVLLDQLSRRGSGSLAALVDEPEFAELAIYEPGIIGPFRRYLERIPGYRTSYYWEEVPRGETHRGVRCEDLQDLTFEDRSFDLVITSDIFEHIREPLRAFAELRRVLKPNGRHVFTVPMQWPLPPTTVSRLRLGTEQDEPVLPLVYHSSPTDPQGSLVYTDFGLDLPMRLVDLGFETHIYYGPRYNLTFSARAREG